MFDIARAALLSVGIREQDLPRTHNGLIATFSQHAVQSGRIDHRLAAALGRAETLRLLADYTGTAIDAQTARDTVSRAEEFVGTVNRVFALHESSNTAGEESSPPDDENKVSEPGIPSETCEADHTYLQPVSLEETRRQARENWLRLRQQTIEKERKVGLQQSTGHDAKEDQGHSLDSDLSE
jgi:uncharacterized protein (UPF0332 family)